MATTRSFFSWPLGFQLGTAVPVPSHGYLSITVRLLTAHDPQAVREGNYGARILAVRAPPMDLA